MIWDLALLMTSSKTLEEALHLALKVSEGKDDVTILFPAGIFCLKETTTFQTPSIGHDDGCGENQEKSAHIVLRGRRNLTLKGRRGDDGEILTMLLGHNDGTPQCLKPSILWAEDCPGLMIQDLEFGLDHPACFYGTVIGKDGDVVTIKPGEEDYPDRLPIYCMNRFLDGKLVGPSVTIGFGIDDQMEKAKDGNYKLESAVVAKAVNVGEDLSWHLSGITDFLLFFGYSDGLSLENVRVSEASGFGILTEGCRDLSADHVVIQARKGYQPVSRDGWKIFRCSGTVTVTNGVTEGTRMDGQNVHGNYMTVLEQHGDEVEVEMKYAPSPLTVGSSIDFFGEGLLGKSTILSWKLLSSEYRETVQKGDASAAKAVVGKKNRFNRYAIQLDHLPEGVGPGCYASAEDFTVEAYISRGCTFRNIAGGGNLIRARKALVEGNAYSNIMNAGVLAGAEWDTHAESTNPDELVIRNCTFENVGWNPRYGTKGMGGIATAAQGFGSQGVMGSLIVENCRFSHMARAMEIGNVRKAEVKGNTYEDVRERVFVDHIERLVIED